MSKRAGRSRRFKFQFFLLVRLFVSVNFRNSKAPSFEFRALTNRQSRQSVITICFSRRPILPNSTFISPLANNAVFLSALDVIHANTFFKKEKKINLRNRNHIIIIIIIMVIIIIIIGHIQWRSQGWAGNAPLSSCSGPVKTRAEGPV